MPLTLVEISKGVLLRRAILKREWRVRSNAYCVDGILIEPAVNVEAEALEWIDWCSFNHPRAVFVTHWHPDHLGWLEEISLRSGLSIYGPVGSPLDSKVTVLVPGDRLGNFEVLHAPGHDDDHLVLWNGRVLVLGDAHQHGLGTPHLFYRTCDRLAQLNPEIALPAHGEPFLEHSFLDHIAERHVYKARILSGVV